MRSKQALGALAAISALVAVSAIALKHRRTPPPLAQPSSAAAITTEEVTLNGTIRPQHVAGVGARVSGNIDAFLVEVGEDVYEGQLLARIGSSGLDSAREAATQAVERAQDQVSKVEAAVNSARLEASRAEADAQRARAGLDRAQKAYERQTTLHRAGATPKLVYERAASEYEAAIQEFEIMDKAMRGARDNVQSALNRVAEARKTLAEKQEELHETESEYEAAELRAPVDGMVVGRKGELGRPAEEAGDQLFQIATDIFALEVSLEAKPEVLKRLHPGQPATVLILDLQSTGVPGTVKEIRENAVIVEFGSTTPAIRPGMRADVRLRLE